MIPYRLALVGDFPLTVCRLTCGDASASPSDTVGTMSETPNSRAPTMGLAEAAKACQVSVSTLRRRKNTLLAEGATITDKGWRIPIPALVSLGFMSGTTAPTEAPSEAQVEPIGLPPVETPGSQTLAELEKLRQQLAMAETRAQVAEAIAAERERIIEIQAQALRMLEPTPTATPVGPPTQVTETNHGSPMRDTSTSSSIRPSAGRLRRLLGFGR